MKIENSTLFINSRYTGDIKGIPTYVNHNGVLKKYISSRLANRIVDTNNKYYALEDLPQELQERYLDISVSLVELAHGSKIEQKENTIYDAENTLIFVKDDTLVLPVVGNILPDDGIPAFTVVDLEGVSKLKSILICWGCHWSELFAGITKYENNVFCLASDLTEEQRIYFENEIISLSEVNDYLNKRTRK